MAKYLDNETGEVVEMEPSAADAFIWNVDKTMRNVINSIPGVDFKQNNPDAPSDQELAAMGQTNPVASWVGRNGPGFFGPMRAGMMANTAFSALSGYMTADEEDRLSGGALGAAGGFGGDMAGRMFGKLKNMIGGDSNIAAGVPQELTDRGYKLTPAQRSGSQAQMKIERGMEKNPWNQQRFGEYGKHNEELLNKNMNEAIGLPGDNGPLNRNARTLAAEQIGGKMENIAQGQSMQIDESLAGRVKKIISNDEMLEIPELEAGGVIDGSDYMRIRSDLSRAQRSSQGSAQDYIGKTIKQMDDMFLEVAGPEQAAAYRVAREQYKNLSLFEKGQSLTPDGEVNLRSAGNAFRSKQGYGKRSIDNTLPETRGLISDLDNLTAKSVNPYIGNSGTAEGMAGLWNPGSWPGGLLGAGYLDGGVNIRGVMNPADPKYIGLGANIGRGLLTQE